MEYSEFFEINKNLFFPFDGYGSFSISFSTETVLYSTEPQVQLYLPDTGKVKLPLELSPKRVYWLFVRDNFKQIKLILFGRTTPLHIEENSVKVQTDLSSSDISNLLAELEQVKSDLEYAEKWIAENEK